jgi:hypothetical protein
LALVAQVHPVVALLGLLEVTPRWADCLRQVAAVADLKARVHQAGLEGVPAVRIFFRGPGHLCKAKAADERIQDMDMAVVVVVALMVLANWREN